MVTMEIFDTHCHIDDSEFDTDRDRVLSHCRDLGVNRILVPAVGAENWHNLLTLCHQHGGLYPALGMHPIYSERHQPQHISALRQLVGEQPPVAIGEIGLDFYIDNPDKQRQQQYLEAQLDIARDMQLPVVLHVRKAHDEILATLRRIRVPGGIAHAFNGSLQQAAQYIDLGFKLGFGGTLTYERSNKIRRLAKELPMEAIVLETDAPDMVVSSHRGQRNSPEYLPECLAALATLRNESQQTIAQQTTLNALQVLNLHSP